MKKLIIILDPAHGSDVAGKRSPDGLHREYKWSREICADLKILFEALGYEVHYTNYLDTACYLAKSIKQTQVNNSVALVMDQDASVDETLFDHVIKIPRKNKQRC